MSIQESPDIVIMDIRLPGIDGVESARIMQDRNPELKVIMLSIQEDDIVQEKITVGRGKRLCHET